VRLRSIGSATTAGNAISGTTVKITRRPVISGDIRPTPLAWWGFFFSPWISRLF
jgi:hypothetical protein